MKIFKLPDLGEGLPDAIIREWHVKPGDEVHKDQRLVSVETAKALVDVPAPFDAVIEKCFGAVDETIETGAPLIGFEGEAEAEEQKDTGTVVGKIEQSDRVLSYKTPQTVVPKIRAPGIKATPAVRALARQLHVDLTTIKPKGPRITTDEVIAAAQTPATTTKPQVDSSNWQPLSGIKKAMALSMKASHQAVVPATIIDDADIHTWSGKQDVTVRIIRAIIHACEVAPTLNALFDGENLRLQLQKEIHIGLAVDMPHGLFVPVIKDVGNKTDEQLRETMERFKNQAKNKTLPKEDLHGASILLSNFGVIAGRYANPVVVPPTVAIIGIGRLHKAVVPDQNDQPVVHPILPISLTFDHRAITGGEAARFLGAMVTALNSNTPKAG